MVLVVGHEAVAAIQLCLGQEDLGWFPVSRPPWVSSSPSPRLNKGGPYL